MSKFSLGWSRLFLRAGFRPRGVIGLPGGSLMPKQGGFHETDRQSFGQNRPGQEQGLFLAVFCPEPAVQPGSARLRPYLYIIPFFLAYLVLDFSLRFTYRGMGIVGVKYLPAGLFTLGWALVFAGLVFFLPKVPRWFVRCVPPGDLFVVLAITHSGFMSAFRKFFSFSSLSFGGTGSFVDASYITINWKVIAGSAIAVLLMMISGRLLKVIPQTRQGVCAGRGAGLPGGAGLVAFTHIHYFPVVDRMIWETSPRRTSAWPTMSSTTPPTP